jgi:membrane dipeptidase
VIPVLDGHNDTLLRLRRSGTSFAAGGADGHVDLPRARAGGLAAGFFAVFVPNERPEDRPDRNVHLSEHDYDVPLPPPVPQRYAARFAETLVESLHALERDGDVAICRTVADVERSLASGSPLGAILHLEGAEPLDQRLRRLEPLAGRGLRSIGLVWSRPNAFAHGVPFRFPSSPDTGPGLTAAGRRLVRACNALGLVVDLAHLNEAGFHDAARISKGPLVVTHACAHAICAMSRNLTDAQLDAVRDSGGIVGVAFDVAMLRPDGHLDSDVGLELVVRHVDHLAERMGIDHVGFGSDFDGCTVPGSLPDVAALPRLLEALAAAGYDDESLRKLAHGNWLRVLRATWQA